MSQTCRICLRNDSSIVNDVRDYIEIIKDIAQIELIINDDEYPSKVCNDCTKDLLNAKLLREMLLECNVKITSQSEEITKEEPLEPDVDDDDMTTTEFLLESDSIHYDVQELIPTRIQRNTREQNFECHYCQTCHKNLELHMITSHPDEPLVFNCRFCTNTYSKFNSLKDHVYKIHKLDKMISCEECGRLFKVPSHLKEHKLKVHSDEKNFACEICPARFKIKSNLVYHMRKHTDERRYKCEFCEKAYKHYSDWKSHHSSHTGDWRYKCHFCEKGFYKPSALKYHLKTHLSE